MVNKCKMSSDINILYHSYQERLKYQHSLHSRLNFTFLSNLVNLLLTGNNMCHSQPMPQFFTIINASCSINLF